MSEQLTDDPFAELEARAKREDAEAKAAKAFSHARARLVLGKTASHAFFASLALRLEARPDWTLDTAATDGKAIYYNPAWFGKLPPDQAISIVAHEVLHLVGKHHARREHREPRRFNEACDAAINPLLRDAGFALPPGGILPGEGPPRYAKLPKGKSAEAYYDLLPPDPPSPKGDGKGDGQGQGDDPGGMGGVRDPGDGSDAAKRQSEAEWGEAVAAAAYQAKQRGALPAALAGLVETVLNPRPDVAEVLRQFVSKHAKADVCWSRPNRRHIGEGLYLPSQHSETVGDVVFAVDCSGSVSDDMVKRMGQYMEGCLEAYPQCKLTIVYHDTEPHEVQQWEPQDGALELHRPCGGGTSHTWLRGWLEEQEAQPSCVVLLTDMKTSFGEPPDAPVLWVGVASGDCKPPYGQFVEVE
jgi:predicted metal-dependent peptidase